MAIFSCVRVPIASPRHFRDRCPSVIFGLVEYGERLRDSQHVVWADRGELVELTGDTTILFTYPKWITWPITGRGLVGTIAPSGLNDELALGGRPELFSAAKNNFLVDGDLGPYIAPVDAHPIARRVLELHEASWQYRETEVYRRFIDLAETGRLWPFKGRSRRSRADVDDYFEYVVRLARSIERHGYVATRGGTGETSRRINAKEFAISRPSDIGCCIGATGELLFFRTGHHRLAICRALGVSSSTIVVHMVHRSWLARHVRPGWAMRSRLRLAVDEAIAAGALTPPSRAGATGPESIRSDSARAFRGRRHA